MKKIFFITATNTNIGKTYLCKKLIKSFSKQGFKVGVLKPFETGVKKVPKDALGIFNLAKKYNNNLEKLHIKDIVTYKFALPASVYVAKKDEKISLKLIKESLLKMQKYCDILLVEGAGGLMVPINKNFFMIDLIKYLKAKAILVCPSKLGCINDTLLSIKALKDKNIKFKFCINLYEEKESFYEVTEPFYKKYFDKTYIIQKDLKKFTKDILSL